MSNLAERNREVLSLDTGIAYWREYWKLKKMLRVDEVKSEKDKAFLVQYIHQITREKFERKGLCK